MVRLNSFIVFFVTTIITMLGFVFSPQKVEATRYDLIAPSGQLQRGQNVQFTINVDTEGQSLTTATIGMTYKTDVLQYVSTTPGNTFSTVSTQTLEGGKLIFTATSSSSFSGTGTFAVVTFKIIANAPGSTELCVLFNPQTPTTAPPPPTAIPKTGSILGTSSGAVSGIILLVLAAGALIFYNHKPYRHPPVRPRHKTLH